MIPKPRTAEKAMGLLIYLGAAAALIGVVYLLSFLGD
jgi:hypothetical protein